MKKYDHKKIESKWQKYWQAKKIFVTKDSDKREKKYILDMFPYPSGAGLHVGHPEGYTATDILSRYLRMRGFNVLHPMGWDAFGLPAENYAIKEGVHPQKTTEKNIKRFREQIQSLGLSYDWSREVNTSAPGYYKWTQWLFLQLYKKGLAYKKLASVNWCPKDNTVLANEQVINGACERCGTSVVQKNLSQWFFKITNYAEELLSDLDKLDWPAPIKTMQRNWIGKSVGAEIDFALATETEKDCLVVHGVSGSSTENWFPWIKNILAKENWKVVIPDLPGAGHPTVAGWNDVLTNSTRAFKENSVLIGHSIGVPAVLNLVQTANKKINKLILVAPVNPYQYWDDLKTVNPDLDWGAVREFAEIKFDWKKITSLAKEIVFCYSDNDKYIPPESVDYYKKNLPHATFRFLSGKGHFNKSAGVMELPEILDDISPKIKVFTTRVDTLPGATFIVMAPEHPVVAAVASNLSNFPEVLKYIEAAKNKTNLQRSALEKEKTGVELKGVKAVNPVNGERLPIWIADYALMGFGTGALFGDAHDGRDQAFAKKYNIPLKVTLKPADGRDDAKIRSLEEVFEDDGILYNSGEFDGLTSEQARTSITKWLVDRHSGRLTISYKLRDWLISRQRYWGAPIPIIYCPKCGEQAVPEKDLPVKLPGDVDFRPTGESPLKRSKKFGKVVCPNCKGKAERDFDTMDTFVDSSWYYFRYTDSKNKKVFADAKKIQKWLPVDTYVGGAEHAVLHLLYSRFFTKALCDFGMLNFREPFLKLRNQGLILGPDGEKMSKSRGNVINPDDVVKKFGADSLRMYEMFMGPLEDAKPWQTNGIVGVKRFLDRVWGWVITKHEAGSMKQQKSDKVQRPLHKLIKKITEDIESFSFNTSISAFMEFHNQIKEEPVSISSVKIFLTLLYPFAPHVTEELNYILGGKKTLQLEAWPVFNPAIVIDQTLEIVVQINGKVKGKISTPVNSNQQAVEQDSRNLTAVKIVLLGQTVKRVVFVQNRLINFVI